MDENPTRQWVSAAQQDPQDAKFFWTGGPVEVAADTWFASLGSGVTAFPTRDGLVLVDTGTRLFAGEIADRIRTRTDLPVHTAIYTHGHIDHAFGLEPILVEGQDAPHVVAQERMAEKFARYERSRGTTRPSTAASSEAARTIPPSKARSCGSASPRTRRRATTSTPPNWMSAERPSSCTPVGKRPTTTRGSTAPSAACSAPAT